VKGLIAMVRTLYSVAVSALLVVGLGACTTDNAKEADTPANEKIETYDLDKPAQPTEEGGDVVAPAPAEEASPALGEEIKTEEPKKEEAKKATKKKATKKKTKK
jgi:hypothetical protein